jgi:hypothetical protein
MKQFLIACLCLLALVAQAQFDTNPPGAITLTGVTFDTNAPSAISLTNRPAPLDADAVRFIVATGITNTTIQTAINTLVITAKSNTTAWPSGWWTSMACVYPFVGGTASANSKNLKGTSFTITWHGTLTHDSNGVTGDGSTGYGDTGFNCSTAGTYTQNSATMLCYVGTATPTDGGLFMACSDGSFNAGVFRTGSNGAIEGPNSGTAQYVHAVSDFRGANGFSRNSSANFLRVDPTGTTTVSDTSGGAPNAHVGILTELHSDNTSHGPSNANLKFAMIGGGMTSGQYTELAAAILAFETALGRN